MRPRIFLRHTYHPGGPASHERHVGTTVEKLSNQRQAQPSRTPCNGYPPPPVERGPNPNPAACCLNVMSCRSLFAVKDAQDYKLK